MITFVCECAAPRINSVGGCDVCHKLAMVLDPPVMDQSVFIRGRVQKLRERWWWEVVDHRVPRFMRTAEPRMAPSFRAALESAAQETAYERRESELRKRFPDPEAFCPAHGEKRCERCARNPGDCVSEHGSCSYWSAFGMHWDTCANRIRGPLEEPRVLPHDRAAQRVQVLHRPYPTPDDPHVDHRCSGCISGYDPRTGELVASAYPCSTIRAIEEST